MAGCTIDDSLTIVEPLPLSVDFEIVPQDEWSVCPYTWEGSIQNLEGGSEPYSVKWYFEILNESGEIVSTDSIINIHNWSCKPGPMNIRLEVDDQLGCEQTHEYVADELVHLNELSSTTVTMFPNPCKGQCLVSSDRPIRSVEIVDTAGHSVYNQNTISSPVLNMDLSHISTGLYLLRLSLANGGFRTLPLIIKTR